MSGSLNRTTHASLKLWEEWSIGWLVSAIVNLLVLTATAIWLLPVDRPSAPVELVARVDTDEGDLEALIDVADLEPLDKQFNRSYTPIHTIAYENPISKERMEVLAELSRGKYRYIPPMESTADDSVPRKRRR